MRRDPFFCLSWYTHQFPNPRVGECQEKKEEEKKVGETWVGRREKNDGIGGSENADNSYIAGMVFFWRRGRVSIDLTSIAIGSWEKGDKRNWSNFSPPSSTFAATDAVYNCSLFHFCGHFQAAPPFLFLVATQPDSLGPSHSPSLPQNCGQKRLSCPPSNLRGG